MRVRNAQEKDRNALVNLIDSFRAELAQLRNRKHKENLNAAEEELDGYSKDEYPIYIAESDGEEISGYMVCRVVDGVVWVESIYVLPRLRRHGIAGALYEKAEQLAVDLGGDAPYNWVDPNNDTMIRFLKSRGYSVLNLIELRRPRTEESLTKRIFVGHQEFDRP